MSEPTTKLQVNPANLPKLGITAVSGSRFRTGLLWLTGRRWKTWFERRGRWGSNTHLCTLLSRSEMAWPGWGSEACSPSVTSLSRNLLGRDFFELFPVGFRDRRMEFYLSRE